MGGFRISGYRVYVTIGLAAALSSCLFIDEPEIDFAKNHYIYQPSAYKAPRRTASAVFVTRLRDRRVAPDLDKGPNYRQVYSDRAWDRAVPVMLEELLINEIDASGIYNGISTGSGGKPTRSDVIIEPTLLAMYRMREVMTEAGMTGMRRTVAFTSLRLRVRGPVDSIGNRPVLMDETFSNETGTTPSLARPEEGFALTGMTLSDIVRRALPKIYESNSTASADPVPASAGKTDAGKAAAGKTEADKSGAKTSKSGDAARGR